MGDVLPLKLETSPLAAYLRTLDSLESRRTMRCCIENIQTILGHQVYSMTPAEVGLVRDALAQKFPSSPASRNKHLSALRGYAKVAVRMKLMSDDVLQEILASKNYKGTRVIAGRMLAAPEIEALFSQCPETTPLGARDAAMLTLLRAGLRRSEVVGVQVGDIDWRLDSLRVLGKGDKQRNVPLPQGGRRRLLQWLAHRGAFPGPLLTRTDILPTLESLSEASVWLRLKRLWSQAGCSELSAPSPHDLRRTLASELLDQVDPRTVQELLGHELLETTMGYDRRPETRKKKAMELIVIPGGKEDVDNEPQTV